MMIEGLSLLPLVKISRTVLIAKKHILFEIIIEFNLKSKSFKMSTTLECTGKPYLLKAQHCAFNISDSTTIPLTV